MIEFLLIVFLLLIIIVLVSLFLIHPVRTKNQSLDWLKGYYCHRGYFDNVTLAENSIGAFQNSIDHQFGIELDVQLTKDHHVVVFHDDDLKRMANQDIKIKESTLAQLKQYRLVNTDACIPTFQEVLDLVDGSVPIYVEIKDFSMDFAALVDQTMALLSGYTGKYAICSFNPMVLIHVKKSHPEMIRGMISQNYKAESIPGWQKVILQNLLLNFLAKPHFISYGYNDINLSFRLCRWLGAKTAGWAIGSMEEQRRYEKYFDMIVFEHYDPTPREVNE